MYIIIILIIIIIIITLIINLVIDSVVCVTESVITTVTNKSYRNLIKIFYLCSAISVYVQVLNKDVDLMCG